MPCDLFVFLEPAVEIGVQVFDSDGRYLNVFKPDGVASGMVFNDKNELFIVARNKVMKFVLNQ